MQCGMYIAESLSGREIVVFVSCLRFCVNVCVILMIIIPKQNI